MVDPSLSEARYCAWVAFLRGTKSPADVVHENELNDSGNSEWIKKENSNARDQRSVSGKSDLRP